MIIYGIPKKIEFRDNNFGDGSQVVEIPGVSSYMEINKWNGSFRITNSYQLRLDHTVYETKEQAKEAIQEAFENYWKQLTDFVYVKKNRFGR